MSLSDVQKHKLKSPSTQGQLECPFISRCLALQKVTDHVFSFHWRVAIITLIFFFPGKGVVEIFRDYEICTLHDT